MPRIKFRNFCSDCLDKDKIYSSEIEVFIRESVKKQCPERKIDSIKYNNDGVDVFLDNGDIINIDIDWGDIILF